MNHLNTSSLFLAQFTAMQYINITVVSSPLIIPDKSMFGKSVECILNGKYSLTPVSVNVTKLLVIDSLNSDKVISLVYPTVNILVEFSITFMFPVGSQEIVACNNMRTLHGDLVTRMKQAIRSNLFINVFRQYCEPSGCNTVVDEMVITTAPVISPPFVVGSSLCVASTSASSTTSLTTSSIATISILFFVALLILGCIVAIVAVVSKKRKVTEKSLEEWIESSDSDLKVSKSKNQALRYSPSMGLNDIYAKKDRWANDEDKMMAVINPVFEGIANFRAQQARRGITGRSGILEGDIGDDIHRKRLSVSHTVSLASGSTGSDRHPSLVELYDDDNNSDNKFDSYGHVPGDKNPIFGILSGFVKTSPRSQPVVEQEDDIKVDFQQFHHDFLAYQGEAAARAQMNVYQEPVREEEEQRNIEESNDNLDILELFSGNDPYNDDEVGN